MLHQRMKLGAAQGSLIVLAMLLGALAPMAA